MVIGTTFSKKSYCPLLWRVYIHANLNSAKTAYINYSKLCWANCTELTFCLSVNSRKIGFIKCHPIIRDIIDSKWNSGWYIWKFYCESQSQKSTVPTTNKNAQLFFSHFKILKAHFELASSKLQSSSLEAVFTACLDQ